MKIKMLKSMFGLEKGYTYSAEVNDEESLIVTNGTFRGKVFNEDIEVLDETN